MASDSVLGAFWKASRAFGLYCHRAWVVGQRLIGYLLGSPGMLLGRLLEPVLKPLGASWGLFGGLLGPLLGLLGASWGLLAVWGPLGAEGSKCELDFPLLGPSWGHLGPSLAPLGPSWGSPGPSWGSLGGCLLVERVFKPLGVSRGPLGGLFWASWETALGTSFRVQTRGLAQCSGGLLESLRSIRLVLPPCLGCGSEASWIPVGFSWHASRVPLGASFETSWSLVGAVWGPLGTSFGPLGGLLGPAGGLGSTWGGGLEM